MTMPDRKFRLRDHIVINEEDSGAILLDTRGGTYWQINQTTVHVLRLLESGHPSNDIVDILATGSDGESARVRADIANLITTLLRSRIIRPLKR